MEFLNKSMRNALTVQAILNTPPISSEAGLAEFRKQWEAGTPDSRRLLMSKYFDSIMEAQAGHEIESERVQKNLQALGTFPSVRVGDYASFGNELTQDMKWMPAFTLATANGASTVDIIDFESFVTVKELQPTQKIELSQLGTDAIAKMAEKRFGAGVPMSVRWLETNGVYNLNTAVEAIRNAFLIKQANFAYALLAGSANGTTTATAATVDAIITALNSACLTLSTANANNGFAITDDTPFLFYLNIAHKGIMTQVMNRMMVSTSADEYTSIKLTHMVMPIYTHNSNMPSTFAGKNAGMLVLPGRKNVWVNFKASESNQETDFSSSSIVVQALQYWNAQAPAAQRQIVNLEA